MLATLLLGLGLSLGLLADIPAGSAPTSADLGAYEEIRKRDFSLNTTAISATFR